MDPMGIHTGDSITVAPAMTLSDRAFQRMRDMAIKMMRSIGDFAGGCNVQFAVSPDEKEEIIAIEINPGFPDLLLWHPRQRVIPLLKLLPSSLSDTLLTN